jgi:HEAT repeat protein
MQSSSSETRLISLQVLSPDLIARHPLETMPVLEALLGESNPKARALAATRLGFLGKTGMNAVPVLRRLSTDDPDPDVRKSAALSLMAIQNAGKTTSR